MDFRSLRARWLAALCLVLFWPNQHPAAASPPIRVVVSFSILGDFVNEIGGGDVAVTSLIGPDSDVHVLEPTPEQARLLANAQLFVINGLGLEGWLTRLTQSAQYRGPVVVAARGIDAVTTEAGEPTRAPDPHAWQDPRNAVVYANNIRQALAATDPAHSAAYRQRFRRYEVELEALD